MEKLSRVKKYEDLRKSIETENTVNEPFDDSMEKEQKEALKKFDSSILKKVDIKPEDSYVPEREKINAETKTQSNTEDTFTNEYLDDFIREVREYNIQKGNRESDDTQVDILAQLNSVNRAKRARYVQSIQEEQEDEQNRDTLSKEAIAFEVKNLLLIEDEEELSSSDLDSDVYATTEMIIEHDKVEDMPVMEELKDEIVGKQEEVKQEEITPRVKKIITPVYDMDGTDLYETFDQTQVPKDSPIHKRLVEETQQLRVQMDEYEEELTDLSDGVEKNNKLLNFILCFLILVLLVIIGFIGYYIWKGGGF